MGLQSHEKSEKPLPLRIPWYPVGNSALTKVKQQPGPRPSASGLYCSWASVLLLLLLRLAFGGPQGVPHLCVHEGPNEDKQGAQPVPQGERVLEVQDGKDEADELAQCHDKGDGEGGAFSGENEDAPDAHIPGGAGLRQFSVNNPEISGRTFWQGL